MLCRWANVIDKIKCQNRIGYDRSDTLIALLNLAEKDFSRVLKDGNRELWDKGKGYVKDGIMPEDMSLADIGAMEFFASFSNGGFPRGYAKNTDGRNYFKEAYRNMEAQAPQLKGIIFECQNYDELFLRERLFILTHLMQELNLMVINVKEEWIILIFGIGLER